MAIINIYSKRQRKIRGEVNDVYQYNNIPHALRVQIIKIITDSIGFPSSNERYTSYRNEADKVYAYIHEILSKEYGVFSLKEFAKNDFDALVDFFLKERNTEKCLDFIEICFQILVSHVAKNHYEFKDITSQSPGDAVIELNERFREHGVGYQFESEEIIRIDSQL
ncbi:TPA: hypothetical protein OGS09_004975, partial [Escherichia coli]|nr:hypothetical protein [Escherichia coli]